jgi:hypothetical protein
LPRDIALFDNKAFPGSRCSHFEISNLRFTICDLRGSGIVSHARQS